MVHVDIRQARWLGAVASDARATASHDKVEIGYQMRMLEGRVWQSSRTGQSLVMSRD